MLLDACLRICWLVLLFAGPTQKPQINLVENPGEFLGVTEFGFSKKNELFVGEGPKFYSVVLDAHNHEAEINRDIGVVPVLINTAVFSSLLSLQITLD